VDVGSIPTASTSLVEPIRSCADWLVAVVNESRTIVAVSGAMARTDQQVTAVETQAEETRIGFTQIRHAVEGISARVSQLSAGLQELSASATEAGSVSLEVAQTADRLAHVANGEGPG
jgi:methyl-accepting chemotaxis protein